VADGQVGGGVAELALVWREGGKGVGDRARQGTEGAGVARGEPEHLIAEPPTPPGSLRPVPRAIISPPRD
jgi:hypothetical protein